MKLRELVEMVARNHDRITGNAGQAKTLLANVHGTIPMLETLALATEKTLDIYEAQAAALPSATTPTNGPAAVQPPQAGEENSRYQRLIATGKSRQAAEWYNAHADKILTQQALTNEAAAAAWAKANKPKPR